MRLPGLADVFYSHFNNYSLSRPLAAPWLLGRAGLAFALQAAGMAAFTGFGSTLLLPGLSMFARGYL